MYYLRAFLVILWVPLFSLAGMLICLSKWGDINLTYRLAHLLSQGLLFISGIRIEVEGIEHLEAHQPCIYVGNHQSGFDLATFGHVFPHRTVSIGKKEIKWIPLFGLAFAASGNIMIDRKNRTRSVADLNRAVESMKREKKCIWIFPEGTRNRTGEGLLPFKKGAFYMAIQGQVPVLPLVCSPIGEIVSAKKRKLGPGVIRIRVLPPIMTQGMNEKDVERLSAEVREKMLEALRGLSPRPA